MNKIIAILLVLCSFCISSCDSQKPVDDNVIKIGVNLPLSGNQAVYGNAIKKGLELSLKDANENSLKYKYKLFFQDDNFDIKQANKNLNHFRMVEKVDAVISFGGSVGTITSNWAKKHKIIHFGCGISNNIGDGLYSFNHSPNPAEIIAKLLKHYKQQNYRNVGIAYTNTIEMQDLMNLLSKSLKENNFNVSFTSSFNPAENDMRIDITKTKDIKTDVVAVLMNSPEMNFYAKQLKELDINTPLTPINNTINAKDDYHGQTFIVNSSDKNFEKHYTEQTGKETTSCVINLYDSLQMLIYAYENTPKEDTMTVPIKEAVVQTLLNINNLNYQSVFNAFRMDDVGNIMTPVKVINL